MINYKIISFDKNQGLIVINYEGYEPVAFNAPHYNGEFLSGNDFEVWVQTNFNENKITMGLPRTDFSTISGGEWIEQRIDSVPFPVIYNLSQ